MRVNLALEVALNEAPVNLIMKNFSNFYDTEPCREILLNGRTAWE